MTDQMLLGALLRLSTRDGSMCDAVKAWERDNGHTLPATPAFVQRAQRLAKALADTADAMESRTLGE